MFVKSFSELRRMDRARRSVVVKCRDLRGHKIDSPALTWLPVAGGTAQLAIARRYFFHGPFIGVAIATVCFLVAAFALSF